MEIEIVTLSKQGARPYNEDVFGHWHDERYVVCVVADGAGGHGGGDVASSIVRASVLKNLSEQPGIDSESLRRAVDQANVDVVARQAEGGQLAAMRSTVVVAVVDLHDHLVAWAHSGDSRVYLFRGGALAARTVDHSLVQQMVAGGMIDEEAARLHPQRNMLLSALGSIEQAPEVTVSAPMPFAAGDALLLCSDGVWEPIGDACIGQALQASRNPSHWIEAIDQEVRAAGKPDQDNYTALAMWANDDDDVTQLLPVD